MIKILTVIDAQADFIDGCLGTREARQAISRLVGLVRDFEGRIFATKDTHKEDYLDTMEGKMLPVPHTIEGTEGWEFDSDLKSAFDSKEISPYVVTKTTFGSLILPDKIIDQLKDHDLGDRGKNLHITIVGFCTDICVVSNALILRAAFPDAEIEVIKDCCAGVTPEKHEAALNVMSSCQIKVV